MRKKEINAVLLGVSERRMVDIAEVAGSYTIDALAVENLGCLPVSRLYFPLSPSLQLQHIRFAGYSRGFGNPSRSTYEYKSDVVTVIMAA